MSSFLLDTHVLLWWLADPGQLTEAARAAIADGEHSVYVSSAAAWEMAIKKALGRLDYPSNLEEVLARDNIETLPIKLAHALSVANLPAHHQDPFDRMQIVQARLEGLVLITRDPIMSRYDVEVLAG